MLPIPKPWNSIIQAESFPSIAIMSCHPKLTERAYLNRLTSSVSVLDDPIQLAYKAIRSILGAAASLVHNMTKSLDASVVPVRWVFLDVSSAFMLYSSLISFLTRFW